MEKRIEDRILALAADIELVFEELARLKLQNKELLQKLKYYKDCAEKHGCKNDPIP